jgi:hypothetical protein
MTATTPTARQARTRTRRATAAARSVPALLPGFARAAAVLPPPREPAAVRAPAGNVPFLPGHAAGTRTFIGRRAATPSPGYAWAVPAPAATLAGAAAGVGYARDYRVYRAAWS